ncbi:MAG: GTPase [Eudoraea sp.]|nr:GTPase [Eudoraea sp.]
MITEHPRRLLFIYNADSGLGNALLDAAHKVVNPETYSCSLCQLTFGTFREKNSWKKFREGFHLPMKFLHKDEFFDAYQNVIREEITLPIIYTEKEGVLSILVKTSELNELKSEAELIERIKERTSST